MSKIILPTISLVFFSFLINQILTANNSHYSNTFLAIAKDKDDDSDDKSSDKDTPAKLRKQRVSDPNSSSNQPRTQNTLDNSTANPPSPDALDSEESKKIKALIQKTEQTLQTPQIISPSDREKVKGGVKIEVLAPEAYSVDLSLQTAAGPAKAFYLGVVSNHDLGKFVFDWDTNNTPNWSYILIAKANFNFHQSLFAKNIGVIVDNPIPELPKEKDFRDRTLKKLGLPTSDQISKASETIEPAASNEPAKAETKSNKETTTPKSETIPSVSPTPVGQPTRSETAPSQASPSASPASGSRPSASPSISAPPIVPSPSPSPSPLASVALPEKTNVEAVVNASSELGFSPAKIVVVKEVSVEKVENASSKDNKTALVLKGKALPNSIVTVYILSDPIVVTVKADANGNWTYVLDKPLVAGEHETFVTVAKPDGSLVRSEVTTFSIAKAAGGNQEEGLVLVAESGNKFQVFITYTAGLIVLAVTVLLAIFFFRKPAVVEDVVD